MKKVGLILRIAVFFTLLVILASFAGCRHAESYSSASVPTPSSTPVNQKPPAVKVEPDSLVEYITSQNNTTADNPTRVEISIPQGTEDFTIPDLSELAESDVYFELIIPEGVTDIGESLQGLETLTCVTIPDSVTTLAADTFAGCTGLTSVTVPGNMDGYERVKKQKYF